MPVSSTNSLAINSMEIIITLGFLPIPTALLGILLSITVLESGNLNWTETLVKNGYNFITGGMETNIKPNSYNSTNGVDNMYLQMFNNRLCMSEDLSILFKTDFGRCNYWK